MDFTIAQDVVTGFEHLVGEVKDELGVLAHAIAASVKYDVEKLKGMAVALVKADISNLWITVKDMAGQVLAKVKDLPFADMIKAIHDALLNINWKAVSDNLEGIGAQTLLTLARAAGQMLITGVIAAA